LSMSVCGPRGNLQVAFRQKRRLRKTGYAACTDASSIGR
jgi:hypothetical protein